ncbi:MAG: SDR family oxidoreductase [Bacteroidota bacterium]
MSVKSFSRIVWITGASSGIGRALAEEFASAGDRVIITSRNRAKVAALQRMIAGRGGACDVEVCDVRDSKSVRNASRKILKRYKGMDVLINNAGATSFTEFLATSEKEFDDVIDTNLRGMFLTTRNVLPAMVKARKGLIVNILSYASRVTYTKSAAYSASKAGGEAMMNVLRAELREKGIQVVNVFPGAVATPMWPAKFRKRHAGRMMIPEDIARLVYNATIQPPAVMLEELVIRPQRGDLRV